MSELVPISFHKLMQSRTYSVIVLGTQEKRFAIYADPQVGHHLQLLLTDEPRPRPSTFDLVWAIFAGLNMKVVQVVIHDVEETVYFGRLFLEIDRNNVREILEIDARPSDCLALALLTKAPLFCKKEVFDKAVAVEE